MKRKTIYFISLILVISGTFTAEAITKGEALEYLYSTLSLPDRADYEAGFYEENVEAALRVRREMPWGDSIPDREFLHFVVPVRVYNENLDRSRMLFYEELKPRVEHLSMKDAILEVNHWCHEKVTYKPSDGRTSSPLSSVSQAIGRCGEESTLAVAALRSVGIPARQIYTPRWAHTDDNHAWVEAWADGNWYFIGACEPEPVLNLAWFNEPASRGMLMNTNVAGDYDGPEEVLERLPFTTRINVTSNYAPTDVLRVKVLNADGSPAAGASVGFCIYNYAEYYPAVTKTADSDGMASLTTGMGDVVVWASDGKRFGLAKGNPQDYSSAREFQVIIDKDTDYTGSFEFNIIPPSSGTNMPAVTAAQRAANDRLMHLEDSIRNDYTATFATPSMAQEVAKCLALDETDMVKILTEARGNHGNIVRYLEGLDGEKRKTAVDLLLNINEKDRRDISMDVVADHVDHTDNQVISDTAVYLQYVLNPRVELEYLRPWRKRLTEAFAPYRDEFRNNPSRLVEWTASNIKPADNENPGRLRMSPVAVLESGKGDALSRHIFFVAAARSIGIPARIDPVTGTTQYMNSNNVWVDVDLGKSENNADCSTPKGKLKLVWEPEGNLVDPKYYSHFSISKIEGGKARLLEFDENGTVGSIFNEPYTLDEGQYILTSGQRLANGGVLARSEVFEIKPEETTEIQLQIRHDDTQLSVIGSLNAENIYHDLASDSDRSILSTTGRGYYILGLIQPNHEPSAHALNDMSKVARELEASGRKIVLLFDNEGKAGRFDEGMFPDLPENIVFGLDVNGASREEIIESLHLDNAADPVFVLADTFNRIVWYSTGYTIGLGERIMNLLSRVKQD